MSLFDKVKKVAKETIDEMKAKRDREKVLWDLTKSQLYDLAIDYGVPITKGMPKEDMISELSKCKELMIKDVMKKTRKKRKTIKRKTKTTKIEDVEMEQEIIRTEKITTRVKKKSISYDKTVKRILTNFDPIIKRKTRERNLEAQLVQSLRAVLDPGVVDYQQRAKSGRVDIAIGSDIAIELKLINSPSQLISLQGQLFNYAQEYKKLYCWIYDSNKCIKPRDFTKFKKNLKTMSLENVVVIKKP